MVDGINAQINTLTEPLSLQASSLAPVKIMGEKIVIDTKGNIKVQQGKIYGNDTFRGVAIIKSGDVEIVVPQTWDSIPKAVILSPKFRGEIWYDNVSVDGFTIKIGVAQAIDSEVSWMAIW